MKTVIEMVREAGFLTVGVQEFVFAPSSFHFTEELKAFAALVRADEREALIHYFNEHWRSDWSDGQIIEAIEARGNT